MSSKTYFSVACFSVPTMPSSPDFQLLGCVRNHPDPIYSEDQTRIKQANGKYFVDLTQSYQVNSEGPLWLVTWFNGMSLNFIIDSLGKLSSLAQVLLISDPERPDN